MPETKSFTAKEIAKHCTRDDIWIVVHGKVYDVTKFLDEHPGGEEVILEHAGIDATEAFEDIGHSDDAHDLLAGLLIGDLEGAAPTAPAHSGKEGADGDQERLRSKQNSSSWGLLIPLAFAVALIAYKIYA
ncbi:Cytochrome b5 [Coemansia spiralis]|uniref:Cytochrome b5 n=1 Tax=Coemansia spiralis TaxID=417178 RepID=A0A9W8G3F2_9FUNG|nr:Cytochrome b5 [Coemansia spiralis]